MAKFLPALDALCAALTYDPESGQLRWKTRPDVPLHIQRRDAGNTAGTQTARGYISIEFAGICLQAHRVAWALYYGAWPREQIDHVNLDKADNRIANLREASQSENMFNRSLQSNNTSGFKGVYRDRNNGSQPWRAMIRLDGRLISLGSYDTSEEAHGAYLRAAQAARGDFVRAS